MSGPEGAAIRLNTERQGLPMPAGSQCAEAILARTDHVRARHGDGAIVMATATPVTNSPAETWVAARLVAPQGRGRQRRLGVRDGPIGF